MPAKIEEIITCMRLSAKMLELADVDNPRFHTLNNGQAALLRRAADDLEALNSPHPSPDQK